MQSERQSADTSTYDPEVLGRMIRAARIIAGYESVAEAIKRLEERSGVHMTERTLYAIERGEQPIRLNDFMAILLAFPVPGGPFFFRDAYREDVRGMLATHMNQWGQARGND